MRTKILSSVLVVAAAAAFLLGGCRGEKQPLVRSLLEGQVTVRAEVDSTADYRGFEVLVASADGQADTLGFAITDSTGFFRMSVTAPERGIYPLVVSRRGSLLKQGQVVIAAGDTASLRLRLPDGNRPLVIRSFENAAWLAYRNSKAVHNRELLFLIQSGEYTPENRMRVAGQGAETLWSVSEQFPGTIGAQVASVESILMLEGFHDSLVVARAAGLSADNPAFADAVGAARRAEARLRGQDSALALVRRAMTGVTDDDIIAALSSEIVVAHVDSNNLTEAAAQAREIISDHPDSDWADWSRDTLYEIENLMPGMVAPSFEVMTWTGDSYSFDAATPGVVLVEFMRPADESYIRERPFRDSLASATSQEVTFVLISVETDADLNEALFESSLADVYVALPAGIDDPVARSYNVNTVPRRFLIRDGKIVGKYTGPAIQAVANDLLSILTEQPS